jgi:hypothetical protein
MAFIKNRTAAEQTLFILAVFIVSRLIVGLLGIHLNIRALNAYWQYLDLETLRNHLLTGIWYDHAQPPVFNLFLGFVLKIGGSHSILLFALILKLISLTNAIFLFSIVKKLTRIYFLPMMVALIYLLSPATLILECELFYTGFISFLLLVSLFYLIRLSESGSGWNAFGVILPSTLLCLTRTVYHIFWLFVVIALLLFYFRKKAIFNTLILASMAGIIFSGSWYVKNKILFGKLTASTWLGMNLARNVFHDHTIKDSSRIEAYEPFSKISVYRKFVNPQFENEYKGLNDRDLLREMKNDSFINETAVSYIPVSDQYLSASLKYIRNHPGAYAKNVIQSSVLFFAPATVYSLAVGQADKIKTYDLIYSFNLTHFSRTKQQRRILLTISAIPKIILYIFVFFILVRYSIKSRFITPWNLFILITIGWVFGISSLFEHYENMRFRFETEPLFLILAAQVFSIIYFSKRSKPNAPLQQSSDNH